MGSLFKKPKAPKMSAQQSPAPVDLGPPPGSAENTSASRAMEEAAAQERALRSKKGYAGTFVNGAMGVNRESIRVKQLTAATTILGG